MKVVAIVYAASLLILLLLYLVNHKKSQSSLFQTHDSWYIAAIGILIVIVAAPIIVLWYPFSLAKSSKQKKEREKSNIGRDKKLAEEKAYKLRALQELNSALSIPQEDHSEVHVATARSLKRLIAAKDYDAFMSCFDHLSLPDGVSLHVEACSQNGLCDASHLFVQNTDGTHDYKIWDYIKVANSVDGAWEACLLSKIWHLLPFSFFDERTYLYSAEDADNIHHYSDDEQNASFLRETVRPLSSAPEVVKAKDRFYVRCCYWTYFGGLIRETTEVFISLDGKASFNDIEQKVLYESIVEIMWK